MLSDTRMASAARCTSAAVAPRARPCSVHVSRRVGHARRAQCAASSNAGAAAQPEWERWQTAGGASTSGQDAVLRERVPDGRHLPTVDWGRYHLQVLFVDRSDTVRARLAAGLFENVACWNGYGRVLLPFSSGLYVRDGGASGGGAKPSPATTASLMSQAMRLGIRPKIFAQPQDQIVREDLDRFDVVVAVDEGLREDILAQLLDPQDPDDRRWFSYYEGKVCALTAFSDYCAAGALRRHGGSALLPSELQELLPPALLALPRAAAPGGGAGPGSGLGVDRSTGAGGGGGGVGPAGGAFPMPPPGSAPGGYGVPASEAGTADTARLAAGGAGVPVAGALGAAGWPAVGASGAGAGAGAGAHMVVRSIERPELSVGGLERWSALVGDVLLCVAGLVQYLIDAYPPDLPEYDPVD